MRKQDVISFFDKAASTWDAELIYSDKIINTILDTAGVKAGSRVLDVACGTGVMIPYYLQRNVSFVTAVDISPEMVKIARSKFPEDRVNILCADVEETVFVGQFDCVMVYNAFPHFPDPEHLIRMLSALVAPGGTLSVAHGMSRAALDRHHDNHAGKISRGLMDENALSALFAKFLTVTAVISDEHMYQVTGTRV